MNFLRRVTATFWGEVPFISFSWLAAEKLVRLVIGLLVGTLAIRYLGATKYGFIAYILSITSIFQALISVGLDGVAVRMLVRNKSAPHLVLGTVLRIRIFSGISCFIASMLLIYLLSDRSFEVIFIGLLIALGMIFQAADVLNIWYQSQFEGRIIFLVRASSFLLASAIKIACVLFDFSIYLFAAIFSIETFFSAYFFILSYRRKPLSISWEWDGRYAKKMLEQGIPIMLTGFLSALYIPVERILLGNLVSMEEVGLYSASLLIIGYLNFLPALVCTSFAPILAALKLDRDSYLIKYSNLMRMVIWPALIFNTLFFVGSNFMVPILYGSDFLGSVPSLQVLTFTLVFTAIGFVVDVLAINTGKTYVLFIRSIISVLLSLILGLVLIPRWGAVGAAYSSLFAGIIGVLISCFLIPSLFTMIFQGLSLNKLIRYLVK